ncbi:methyltransferase [Rickettsiales bacterium Ac37b]|nr:methyltransferase [Rickettsiales bacterium Ac37b]
MKSPNKPMNTSINLSHNASQEQVAIQRENVDQLDRKLEAARTSTWFKTFVENTNQKRITALAFDFLINKVKEKSCHIAPVVLDVGFGEGELSSRIAQSLTNIYPSLLYTGIEYDNKFVDQTKNKLSKLGVNNYELICGNCFGDDLSNLPEKAGLVLASHIAYYAPNMDKFVQSLIDKTADHGLAVFLHESADSDMNKLRSKYCHSINTSSNSEIIKSLSKLEIPYSSVELNAKLTFPDNMQELWSELSSCNYHKSTYRPLRNFELAKNLLEFVAQTPLESLQAKELLSSYLEDVKKLLTNQSNMLIIRTEMQLAISKEASKEFMVGMFSIAKEMQNYVIPLTQISDIQVILTNVQGVHRVM